MVCLSASACVSQLEVPVGYVNSNAALQRPLALFYVAMKPVITVGKPVVIEMDAPQHVFLTLQTK